MPVCSFIVEERQINENGQGSQEHNGEVSKGAADLLNEERLNKKQQHRNNADYAAFFCLPAFLRTNISGRQ